MSDPTNETQVHNPDKTADETEPEEVGIEEMLDRVPPDFKKAKMHGEASLIKNFFKQHEDVDETEEGLICECCGMPTFKLVPKYSICTTTSKFEALGCGFPLFYALKQFVFLVFLGMFLIFGLYAMIINIWNNSAEEWLPRGTPAFSVLASIGSQGSNK